MSDFDDMMERAQHGHFDENGILQVPDHGPWPVICPVCEGNTSTAQNTMIDYWLWQRSDEQWRPGMICKHCFGRGTVIE